MRLRYYHTVRAEYLIRYLRSALGSWQQVVYAGILAELEKRIAATA
jgi:hypothetical protein